jgi:carbonic anhydrase
VFSMRLLEAIVAANHRALAGDGSAGVRPHEHAGALPLAALTCIDPRLNPLIPEVLGVPEEAFIWLRNAGNIITSPLSSTMRSLALACAVKGAKEIVIVGHTDCRVRQTSTLALIEAFRGFGVERGQLPENLQEFFGLFASERQNVLKAVEHVQSSPLLGAKIPVHGLLLDVESGRLEWIVNGYQRATGAGAGPRAELSLPALDGTVRGLEAVNRTAASEPQSPAPAPAPAPAAPPDSLAVAAPQPQVTAGSATPAHPHAGDLPWIAHLAPRQRYSIIGSDSKTYGPVSGAILLRWAAEGRLGAETPIQPEGSAEWRTLASLGHALPPPLPDAAELRKAVDWLKRQRPS